MSLHSLSIGDISINCGSKGTSTSNNGREWIGDIQPKSPSLLQMKGSSTTSTVITDLVSADPVPHKTARISRSQFSYEFQVIPGQKILRLHFNPTAYKGFKRFRDLFTVEAGPFTLLGNFSASLTANALGVDSFIKEFCFNLQENQHLDIIFSPEISHSLDTYAFINGVEIFSVPESLSYFEGGDIGVQLIGEKSLVYFDHNTALEIFHRVKIKKNYVQSVGNSDDMFPKWATRNAKKRNGTWKMPVDVGFKYFIRIHFSELGVKIAGSGDNMFEVLINEIIVHSNIDVVKWRDENNITWYKDYMVMVRGNKREGKRDILISFHTYYDVIDAHALVSGFEIFKLSNSDNSLASPNPSPPARDSPSHTVQTLFLVLCQRNAIANVAIAIISLVCIIVYKLQKFWEANITEEENKPNPLASTEAEKLCRRFSLDEIQLATKKFSDTLLIGIGGFGKVYKCYIGKEQTIVAVKRLGSSSKQGIHEFLTEIETLSMLRHVNLVPLIGYCNEQGEMILVYEYMPCGSLAEHIYKIARDQNTTCSSLTWKQRLDICIGAGRGLDYLHTGNKVIHRDVKATNILLDENLIAKVSDFGLAKPENITKLQSHVSTNVKGTFGYLDPNYYRTHKLTRKSDTYAFGVVLLEVLCGRPAVDLMVVKEERILSIWAQDKINKGEVDQIVAPSLREEISPNSLKTFVSVAERCLSDEPKNRPTMSQVVSQLELAVEQHETEQPLKIAASVQTGQLTIFSTAMQNFTPPPQEQTNSNVVIAQLPLKENELPLLSEFHLGASTPAISESCSTSHLCRRFTLEEIKAATCNFDDNSIISEGGNLDVYKGFIEDGATTVAIKRVNQPHNPDECEFLDKIDIISKLRHLHLMILVYDYMARGSLLDHFCNSEKYPQLTWRRRLKICIGAARGLHYLNTGIENHNMHFEVRLANILLDEKWVAKISFDPSYMWPETYDVYSFGLVLFQVLFTKPWELPNFTECAESCHIGTLKQYIDSNLYGQIAPECLSKFIETALACTNIEESELPAMSDVLQSLEFAMQLQEAADQRGG
ncbi:hypothetical protein ABFS83_06G148600 [Erythranthe nasuta]